MNKCVSESVLALYVVIVIEEVRLGVGFIHLCIISSQKCVCVAGEHFYEQKGSRLAGFINIGCRLPYFYKPLYLAINSDVHCPSAMMPERGGWGMTPFESGGGV